LASSSTPGAPVYSAMIDPDVAVHEVRPGAAEIRMLPVDTRVGDGEQHTGIAFRMIPAARGVRVVAGRALDVPLHGGIVDVFVERLQDVQIRARDLGSAAYAAAIVSRSTVGGKSRTKKRDRSLPAIALLAAVLTREDWRECLDPEACAERVESR
jgi:hypothetical protein